MKIFVTSLLIVSILMFANACKQSVAEENSFDTASSKENLKQDIKIIKKYELPAELNEISGLAWINQNKFACVQDEEGVIFIYDVAQQKIVNRIKFAEVGDFEGLAINESTAYVQRADGVIFIINNYLSANPSIKKFKTGLTEKQNIEGIAFDKINNRLLSAVKDKEPGKLDYKGVYAFDLNSLSMIAEPIFKVPVKDNRFADFKKSTFHPSGLEIAKTTGNIFMVDGRQAGLMVMDAKGNILEVYKLDNKDFAQVESITFDDEGNIYLSSEAGKESAHISLIKISK